MADQIKDELDTRHPLPEDRPNFPTDVDDNDSGGSGGGGTTSPVEKTWWQKHGITVIGIGGIILILGVILLFALT